MNYEEVEAVVGVLRDSPVLTEIEVRNGDRVVRIRRAAAGGSGAGGVNRPAAQTSPLSVSAPVAAAATASPDFAASAPTETAPAPTRVLSGLVGVFHPSRTTPVAEGAVVKQGQVLGQIEAMRLMNDVVASAAGRILSALVQEGQPVEYGQALFEIVPA